MLLIKLTKHLSSHNHTLLSSALSCLLENMKSLAQCKQIKNIEFLEKWKLIIHHPCQVILPQILDILSLSLSPPLTYKKFVIREWD